MKDKNHFSLLHLPASLFVRLDSRNNNAEGGGSNTDFAPVVWLPFPMAPNATFWLSFLSVHCLALNIFLPGL